MQKRTVIASVLLVCLLFICCSGKVSAVSESLFEIKRIGNINSYADNAFQIRAQESGVLTIRIHDNICTYRILTERIEPGETIIHWDGCGYNQEKLYEKTYVITAVFAADSGKEETLSFNSPVEYPSQFLSYALPSSDEIFLDSQETWFLEYRTVTDGSVKMELTAEDESSPLYSYMLPTTGGKILKKDFASISGKKKPSAGRYTASVYEISRPDDIRSFSLTVLDHKPDPAAVTETGEIMPDRSMSEEEIWHMMMMPSVVVDIDYFQHQKVYSEPDAESVSLGTLHGQTQGLKVIRIENEWAMIGAWNHEEAAYIEGWVPVSRLKVEYPGSEYGILIDKQKQTMSVFRNGKVIDTLLVSTGKAEKNKLYQETSAGCFLTGYHRVNFSMNGKKYDYVIQYDGGNLLHQTPYAWGQYKKDFTLGRAYLGAKASHACVRIQAEPGDGGLNAYWLFTHIPYHTRVIILDDPVEREGETELLQRKEENDVDAALLHRNLSTESNDDRNVRITFGGSLIPGGSVSFNRRKDSFSTFTEEMGYDVPFSGIRSIFEQDDLTCVYLSCLIRESNEKVKENKKYNIASTGIEKIFENSSIELIKMDGDMPDNAESGHYQHTVSVLKPYADILEQNKILKVTLKGHLFGFAGCTESEYISDPQTIDRLADELKKQGCEKIIFILSWGDNRASTHSIIQEAMAHRCVRAGADLIVGNNQSAVQGIGYIEGIPVVYSMGMLLDGSTSVKPKRQSGYLLQVSFGFTEGNEPVSVAVIPIQPYGNNNEIQNEYCPSVGMTVDEIKQTFREIWQDTTDSVMNRIVFLPAD